MNYCKEHHEEWYDAEQPCDVCKLEQQVEALKAANKQNAKEAWDAIGSDHDTADQALCEIFNRCTAVHEATAQQEGNSEDTNNL